MQNSIDYYKAGIKAYQERNYEQAIEHFEQASKLNSGNAMVQLGYMYTNGKGVKQDYGKAIEYYEQAVKLNSDNAMVQLGYMYTNGKGVKQDYEIALKYYESASKLNDSYAMTGLGHMYMDGNGVKQDYIRAKKYYKQASKLNNSLAINNLGYLYERGEGVKKDMRKAVKHYEKASKLNDNLAITNLARIYQNESSERVKCLELYDKLYINNQTSLDNTLTKLTNTQAVETIKIFIKDRNEKSNLIMQLQSKIKYLEDEIVTIRYEPGGEGYLEAKEHWEEKLATQLP